MNRRAILLLATAAMAFVGPRTTRAQSEEQPKREAPTSTSEKTAAATAAIEKVRSVCHVSDTETNPKKINKQTECVARA